MVFIPQFSAISSTEAGSGPEHVHDHACHDHDHDHGHECGGHGHGRAKPQKTAVLLATFGSALPEAQAGFALFEDEVRAAFPGLDLAWAFTAHKVRRKARTRGVTRDSPAQALSRLYDAGATHVVVQSLHTVPGVEYHWTREHALVHEHPRKGFLRVEVGDPLLMVEADLSRAAEALVAARTSPAEPDEARVYVGHGTYHRGQARYVDFAAELARLDPAAHLATLMGRPNLDDLIPRLGRSGVRRVRLIPFMSTAGHHVQVDVAGDSPRSWASRLRAAGFSVVCDRTGTLENASLRALWLEHLRAALARLDLAQGGEAIKEYSTTAASCVI